MAIPAPVIPREAVPFYWRTPWYHGWTILTVALITLALTIGTVFLSFTLLVEVWSREFAVERSQVQLAFTAASFGVFGLGLFIGRFFDILSIRVLMAAGVGLFTLTLLLLSATTAVWQVIALYGALLPFAMALCTSIPAQVLAARWFPHKMGFAIGFVNLGLPLAGLAMPPIVNTLTADIGWRPMLQSIAVVTAFLIVPIIALVRNDPPVSAADRAAAPPPPAPKKAMEILTSRGFWILMIVLSLLLSGFTGLNTNFANFGQERGLTLNQVMNVMVPTLSVVGIPAAFLWGYLADKVEHRFLFAIAALAGAVGAAALAFTHGLVAVLAVSALVGLVFGGLFPLLGASLAAQFGAHSLGRATGFAAICIALSSFGAPIFARLYEQWGDYMPVMLVVAATSLAAAGVALMLRYQRR
jgi:MFS family permease